MNNKRRPRHMILALAAVSVFASCSPKEASDDAPKLRQVRFISVKNAQDTITRAFSGSLQSTNQTTYSFRVSGTIQNIAVRVGQTVARNTVLVELDPTDYELQVQRSKASLLEAQSGLRSARASYERTKRLYEAGNSSRSDLDNARAAAETADAGEQAAQKSLQIAERDLAYTRLQSQGECQIASIPVDTGENIAAGADVITATCGHGYEVKLDIPESVISHIERNMRVAIDFPAIPGKVFSGTVNEVGVSSVGGGTTFPVTVLVETKNNQDLKSGLSASVEFLLKSRSDSGQNATVLPSFSVSEDQDGRFVFAIDITPENRWFVRRTPVKIGEILQEGIEVYEGVTPGMMVVTAGVSVLRDGLEVEASQE